MYIGFMMTLQVVLYLKSAFAALGTTTITNEFIIYFFYCIFVVVVGEGGF